MGEGQTTTDDSGQYSFTGLRAGTYSVEISSFDTNEVSFSSTSGAATVGVGESKVVSFDGTYLRTAGIQGQVTVDGEGLQGVTVTLVGEGEDRTEVTNASGQYAFSKLKSGTYQVAITNPDPDDYEFATTSKSATIATGEVANVPFEGTLLRTAGIAGRVSLDDGMGLDGVTVTLAGAAEATAMTSGGGQYAFAGLAAGTYVLSIENPNPTAYNFAEDEMSKNVTLEDDQSAIVNFSGTHTRTASVSGMLFIDEVDQNGELDDGEPSIVTAITPLVALGALDAEVVAGLLAKAKVKLRGPDLNTEVDIAIMPDGSFTTGETLMAGSYQVELPVNDEDVAAGLAAAGVAFMGESMVVTVEAGGKATANFPFRITMQTLIAVACLGAGECLAEDGAVKDVELALYANADMTGMLGKPQKTNEMGIAVFHFARNDNTGPVGNDNIVFVKATMPGNDALAFSGNDFTEVSYASIDRVSEAPAAVTLVNVMANFQFWVKSVAERDGVTVEDGDMGLGGWQVQYCMPMDDDPETEAKDDEVVCTGDDAAFKTIMVGEGDDAEPMLTDDGKMDMTDKGKATFAKKVHPEMLPAMFYVRVTPVDDEGKSVQDDGGEAWMASDVEPHEHTGLVHPDANTAEMNDLGPIYVTWTTQKLTVGVYREVDDEPGWTSYRAPMGGDKRPVADVAGKMRVELMTRDDRNRLRTYEMWDHDRKADTDPVNAIRPLGANGMFSFVNLPADVEFTARLHVGDHRILVGETDIGDVDAFGADLDLGMSQGSFGENVSGAGPEVKLCSLSTDEEECATWAYQWKTGSVTGTVAGPGGATVNLTAETDARGREAKTGADSKKDDFRKFTISNIQDGEYTLTTANTAENKFAPKDGHELEIYHDETKDDENEATTYVGTASERIADFTATKLRLSIKGYVANDGNGDGRARGNEAMAGVELKLLEIEEVSDNEKDTTFKEAAAPVTTDGGGFYEFNELEEGKTYFVQVPDGDDYVGLHTGIGNNKSGGLEPDTYPTLNEGTFDLPSWNYATNMTQNATVEVTAPAPSTVSANLVNFALVYKTSNVSGNVNDVSSDGAGIIVEAAICREYTAPDPDASPPVVEDCNWQREDLVSTRTIKGGDFEFPGLMEGYYSVWYTGGGLTAANLDPDGKVDDDADPSSGDGSSTSPTSRITSVMGRNQYSTGNDFHVYNSRAGIAAALTSLKVEGLIAGATEATDFVTANTDLTPGSGASTDLSSAVSGTVTWASKGVTITTEQSTGASASAFLTTKTAMRSPGNLPYNATGGTASGDLSSGITVRVTAANGYNDHDYTFSVSRGAPVGNTPTSLTATGATTTNLWSAGAFVVQTLAATDATADIVVDLENTTGLPSLQSLSVTIGGNPVACEAGTTDTTQYTCEVTTPVGQTSVKVEVTSEDGIAASTTINFQRPSS